MNIGHVFLECGHDGRDDRFYDTVAALARAGLQQHMLVSGVGLARRLAGLPGVTVGPVVKTPVMAYCLMPNVDLVHVHELQSGQAGLLLTLTRSIPFVLTAEPGSDKSRNPLTRSVLHRAVRLIPPAAQTSAGDDAGAFLDCYEDAVANWYRTAMKA